MSYTHRTPSNPRFRSAKLIQTTFLRGFRDGTIQVCGSTLVGGCMQPPALCCKSRDCSQAATNLQERDKPRNTRNTRKANRVEVSFPRIPRVPRLDLPAFSCGFAALRTFQREIQPLGGFAWAFPLADAGFRRHRVGDPVGAVPENHLIRRFVSRRCHTNCFSSGTFS